MNIHRQSFLTLQIKSMSNIELRAMLAAAMISSCLLLIPAETDLAVAFVMALVHRTRSSGVTVLHPSLVFNVCKQMKKTFNIFFGN